MTDARELTLALGGRWHGGYGAAPCPVCQPERRKGQNGLTLADGRNGRLVLDCKKSACVFRDITTAAGITSGTYTPPDPAIIAQREAARKADLVKRERQARAIWAETLPIAGTVAETYLRGRGITCPLPERLRYHPDCWHGPTAHRHPAMVALVDGSDGFAMHRTYRVLDLPASHRVAFLVNRSRIRTDRTEAGHVLTCPGSEAGQTGQASIDASVVRPDEGAEGASWKEPESVRVDLGQEAQAEIKSPSTSRDDFRLPDDIGDFA